MYKCKVTSKEIEKFNLKGLKNIKKIFRKVEAYLLSEDTVLFESKVNWLGKLCYLLLFPFYIFRDGILEAKEDFHWVMVVGISRKDTCSRKEVVEYYIEKIKGGRKCKN